MIKISVVLKKSRFPLPCGKNPDFKILIFSAMRHYHHPDRHNITLTGVLYGLSDPTRLKIVQMLATQPEITCGEFCLETSKSTQSHHFKVLRDTGIMQTRLEGTQHYNSLRREDLDTLFPNLLDAVLGSAAK